MFLQPDWWEVTKPGVGTNRYAYSFGDPVNKMDPGGNASYGFNRDLDGYTVGGAHGGTAVIAKDVSDYPDSMKDHFMKGTNNSGLIPGVEKDEDFFFMTISGQNSDNNPAYPEHGNGRLVGVVNDKADVDAIREVANGDTGVGSYNLNFTDKYKTRDETASDQAVDEAIFEASARYDNSSMSYNLFGPKHAYRSITGQTGPIVGHNCHGFAAGIAMQAGIVNRPSDMRGVDPGNGVPVPSSAFNRTIGVQN